MIPRWIVYFQAALLGVVALTCFVFGLMVGNLTGLGQSGQVELVDCRVKGQVVYQQGNREVADVNAVVLVMPLNEKPDERVPAELVHPDTFRPLNNAALDMLLELGGAAVRVDERGQFDLSVDGPHEYFVLIVSANQDRGSGDGLSKIQRAAVGTFFRPVDDVVGNRNFEWRNIFTDMNILG